VSRWALASAGSSRVARGRMDAESAAEHAGHSHTRSRMRRTPVASCSGVARRGGSHASSGPTCLGPAYADQPWALEVVGQWTGCVDDTNRGRAGHRKRRSCAGSGGLTPAQTLGWGNRMALRSGAASNRGVREAFALEKLRAVHRASGRVNRRIGGVDRPHVGRTRIRAKHTTVAAPPYETDKPVAADRERQPSPAPRRHPGRARAQPTSSSRRRGREASNDVSLSGQCGRRTAIRIIVTVKLTVDPHRHGGEGRGS